jgi:hypothetical protein
VLPPVEGCGPAGCAFGNLELGEITIVKQTDPSDADGTFTFTHDITAPHIFSLTAGGREDFADVLSGTYTVTETDPVAAFDLTAIWCSDDDSGGEVGSGRATIRLGPGEHVTCTFTDTQRGGITVTKRLSVPVHLTVLIADWAFSGDLRDFTIDGAGGDAAFPNQLPYQSYTISETDRFGFAVSVMCDSGEVGTDSVTVDVDPGAQIVCTFTNTALDVDVDGIFDFVDGEADRDADGLENYLDYDPTGYLYELDSGRIIAGGAVSVTGPTAGAVTLHEDGSEGFYRFTTDGTPGVYDITLTLPDGTRLSEACPPGLAPFDPPTDTNPLVLGAGEIGDTGVLSSGLCGDNEYYFSFYLEADDPFIINNNFPLGVAVVGGVAEPANRLALLAPWHILAVLLGVVMAGAVFWRKQRASA